MKPFSLLTNWMNQLKKTAPTKQVTSSQFQTPTPYDDTDSKIKDEIIERIESKSNNISFDNIEIINDDSFENDHVPGEIMVTFNNPIEEKDVAALLKDVDVKSIEDLSKSSYESFKNDPYATDEGLKKIKKLIGKYYLITLSDKSDEILHKAIDILKRNQNVKYADLNSIMGSEDADINTSHDKNYRDNNDETWNMERISMPDVWNTYSGSLISVAVLDSGIDYYHPDLLNKVDHYLSYDCTTETNVIPSDTYGHGTHVAGIIGAAHNNYGVDGVNPNANLVSVKITNNINNQTNALYVYRAIDYVESHGIRSINYSYYMGNTPSLLSRIQQFSNSGSGTITICAYNDDLYRDESQYVFLSQLDSIIIVAASENSLGEDEDLWSHSAYGKYIHIAAPGYKIYSTLPTSNNNGYDYRYGTSMAAPHVTGVVSMLYSLYPNMTPEMIKNYIIEGADYVPKITGEVSSAGRLNAYKTINLITNDDLITVEPLSNENIGTAIWRCLGTKNRYNIKKLKLIGSNALSVPTLTSDTVNYILPNLEYADLSQYANDLPSGLFSNCQYLKTVTLPGIQPYNISVKLPAYCFMGCSSLKTIYRGAIGGGEKIRDQLDLSDLIDVSAGYYAVQTQCFQGCTSIKCVQLSNTGKTWFSPYVFNNCTDLDTVYIKTKSPETGTADLTSFISLPSGVFRNTYISTVELPKDVSISSEAFRNCIALSEIQVNPSQLNSMTVATDAFYDVYAGCIVYTNQNLYNDTNLIFYRVPNVTIPKSINSLIISSGSGTIKNVIENQLTLYSLTNSSIKHLVLLGNTTYSDSTNYTSAACIPNLKTIDISSYSGNLSYKMFYNCTNLKYIVRSSNLTSIPGACFMYCNKLVGIVEDNQYPQFWNEADLSSLVGQLAINTQGFEACTSLETIKFPSSSIGFPGSFCYCDHLTTIYKAGDIKEIGTFDLTGVVNFWTGWGHNMKYTNPYKIKLCKDIDIAGYSFYNCINLREIDFHYEQINPVTIGSYAFYYVNESCVAYMNTTLVNDSSFELKRSDTQSITKIAY